MGRASKPWYWDAREGWYVTIKGKRRQLASGPKAKTKPIADKEFHRLMLAEGREVETDQSRMLIRDLFDLYLLHCESEANQGQRTRESCTVYTTRLGLAVESVGAIRARDARPKDFLRWVEKPTWGPTHRHTSLAIVKAAFNWGFKVGHIESNPLAGMAMPRPLRRELIPTHEQVEAMAGAAWGQPFRDLLTGLRETGCRPSEISTLTADRVNLAEGTWQVKNKTRRKTGEDFRTIYLSEAMKALSGELIEKNGEGLVFRNSRGGPWEKGIIAYRFIRLRKKLGFGAECTAYAFRHMYITDALEKGVPPATVAELVGHKNLNMIMRFYNQLRMRTDHLRAAARQIRPSDASPAIPR